MEVMYIGHMIRKDDQKVHMKNILANLDWLSPKNLIVLGEFNFHTTFHISIIKYPFKAWCWYGVPNHLDHIFRGFKVQESRAWIQTNKDILNEIKDKLQT